jgi:hypothetical protein
MFDLNFNNYEDGLFLTVAYSSTNYTQAFVENFFRIFIEEFSALEEKCSQPVLI